MKYTMATLKSFIQREAKNGNLYIKTKSTFDGMVDCVMPTKDKLFSKVEGIDMDNEHSFGIAGTWVVRNSRDYISEYADNDFIGYEVSNCCGSFLLAMKRLI